MKKEDAAYDPVVAGADREEGIVAVEHVPGKGKQGDSVVIFVRHGKPKPLVRREGFRPYFWVSDPSLLEGGPEPIEVERLEGEGVLCRRVQFDTWEQLQKALKVVRRRSGLPRSSPQAPYFVINDPVQQYLTASGKTLFKGMQFSKLRRLQVDIETYTAAGYEFCNAQRESDRIIAIALADESGWVEVLSGAEYDEAALLERFAAIVRERDPDVIEGHNIFGFDLPYIMTRAQRLHVVLSLGRDGSPPRVQPGRFAAAERSNSYPKALIFGRHVVDTYFLARTYDAVHRSLETFGLKEIAAHFGISAPNRVYLEGGEIAREYERNPEKVMAYAADDIRETRSLAETLAPTYFFQTRIVPMGYQNICVRGNASKIDALLIREYVRRSHALPLPDTPREFAGGYTDIFFQGVTHNVHHCDVRSLYPSLMLKHRIGPRTDELGAFLELLEYLRDFRLRAKDQVRRHKGGDQRAYYEALNAAFKVLINSFYGYLGFGHARFSDFAAAERVASEGRRILHAMVDWLRRNGARPIEIDTDGIYFVPPEFSSDEEMADFREQFRRSLPEGIEIEFDGEYRAMFSYKMKNYALLTDSGEVIIRGAALKSRGLEPFQRRFMEEMLRLKLEGRDDELPQLKERYIAAIRGRRWPIRMLARRETLQESPEVYREKIRSAARGRNAAYELALKSDREYRAGDQIAYYITGSKKSVSAHANARLTSDWNPDERDENVEYYVAKLEALCRRFGF